jgi:hypothetical protein
MFHVKQMVLLATLILRGHAPAQLGCPTAALAFSPQQVHARIIRLAREDSSWAMPGSGFSVSFFSVIPDTYSVRVWASNLAGAGCDTVVKRTAQATTGVGGTAGLDYKQKMYDVQGRRVYPTRPPRVHKGQVVVKP